MKKLRKNSGIGLSNNINKLYLKLLNKFDKKKYSFNSTSKLPFQDYYYSDESIKTLDFVMNSSTNLNLSKVFGKNI